MNKTHILVSEHQTIFDTSRSVSSGATVAHIQPMNLMDFGSYASQVTFMIRIAAIVGAPTAWSLGVKFQYGFPSTDGYQYTNPQWADLDEWNITADVAEKVGWSARSHTAPTGGGFGIVGDQTDTLPVTAKRTIRNFGTRTRIVLDPKFTGGTNPGLKATILAITGD